MFSKHLYDNLYKDFFRTKVKKIRNYKIEVYNAKWTFINYVDKIGYMRTLTILL